ncbi:MAG: DUF1751 domain-containing protein [Citrobacter freundii]|nr:MAG: DUF1751 domain-containing protein [Citrobacter freundii]
MSFQYTRPEGLPPIIKNIIIINLLVWFAQMVFDNQYGLTDILALKPILPADLKSAMMLSGELKESNLFKPYQIATHFFTHSPVNPFHILFNMFGLWFFGRRLENVWGHQRFLLFYLACGVGAAVFHLLIQYFRAEALYTAFLQQNESGMERNAGALAPVVGASGALMGVLAAFAFYFPNTEIYMGFFPMPIKAKWLVLGYAAMDLFGGIARSTTDNIAHFAHLGGAITGFIIVFIWNKTNRRTLY